MLSRDDVFTELGIGPVWRLRETSPSPLTPDASPLTALSFKAWRG
jgi:DNA polymerase